MATLGFLTFVRLLIVILSAETGVRYLLWWHETRKIPNALLVSLMLGVALLHGTIACMVGFSLISSMRFTPRLVEPQWFVAFSLFILAATFYHLIPCWRLSCGLTTRWVAFNLGARVALAAALAYVLPWMWMPF